MEKEEVLGIYKENFRRIWQKQAPAGDHYNKQKLVNTSHNSKKQTPGAARIAQGLNNQDP